MTTISLFQFGAEYLEPIRYYSYTSIVTDTIVELQRNDEEAEDLWDELIEKAQKKLNRKEHLRDNKCAFEVVYNGHTFFVGMYDDRFYIGLGLKSHRCDQNRVLELIPNSNYSEYGERYVGTAAYKRIDCTRQ